MKRIIATMFVVCIAISFAACDKKWVNGLGINIFPSGDHAQTETPEDLVPDLVGMTIAEAEEKVRGTIYTINVRYSTDDSTTPEGTITSQYPSAGLKFSSPKVIEVTVAVAVKNNKMDDYVGMKADSAINILTTKGLKVTVEEQYSSEAKAGIVLGQKPAKGTEIKGGSTVILFVSSGNNTPIVMPYVTGKPLNVAKKIIEENNLVVGTVNFADSDKEKNTVVSQSVNANASVSEGTVVNLTVSNGSRHSESSSPEQTKSQVYTLQLPDKDEVVVVIYKDGVKVHESVEMPRRNNTFSYTVTGTGVVTIDVYFDDQKVNTREFDFR